MDTKTVKMPETEVSYYCDCGKNLYLTLFINRYFFRNVFNDFVLLFPNHYLPCLPWLQ